MSNPDISLPPAARTPVWEAVTKAAAARRFILPKCEDCQTIQYPPREICCHCLGHHLAWRDIDPAGKVLAFTHLHASLEDFFREHLPMSVAFVKLDSGPCLYAHVAKSAAKKDQRVQVLNRLDKSEQAVFLAIPEGDNSHDYLTEFAHLILPTK